MSGLTHIDAEGRARMVDVSDKAVTTREAVAEGRVRMAPATLELARSGGGKKGDVRAVAEIAGVMAAKRTSDLIPLCHPLALSSVKVEVGDAGFAKRSKTQAVGRAADGGFAGNLGGEHQSVLQALRHWLILNEMTTTNDVERARRDGQLFGIPLGDLGWFASLLMGVAVGMTAFFLATFVAIFVLLIDMSVTHHSPDFAIAYRRVGFPVGVVVMALALGYLGVQWGKRMARKRGQA